MDIYTNGKMPDGARRRLRITLGPPSRGRGRGRSAILVLPLNRPAPVEVSMQLHLNALRIIGHLGRPTDVIMAFRNLGRPPFRRGTGAKGQT